MCVIDDRRIFLKTVLGEVIAQCDQFFFVLHERNRQFGVPPQMGVGYFDPCFISVPLTKLPIVSSSVATETLHLLVNSQYINS